MLGRSCPQNRGEGGKTPERTRVGASLTESRKLETISANIVSHHLGGARGRGAPLGRAAATRGILGAVKELRGNMCGRRGRRQHGHNFSPLLSLGAISNRESQVLRPSREKNSSVLLPGRRAQIKSPMKVSKGGLGVLPRAEKPARHVRYHILQRWCRRGEILLLGVKTSL